MRRVSRATKGPQLNQQDAEEFTQSLGQIVGGSWRQIALAKRLGVPKALGLSVDAWVNQRLGGYIKLTVEDRRKAVEELAAQGESTREIAGVLGVSKDTVHRDLAPVANETKEGESAAPSVSNETTPLNTVAALAADEKLRAQAVTEQKLIERREKNVELKAAALALTPPEGKYRCIVIDPPWEVEPYERTVRPNQPGELDYPTMTHTEIAAFALGDMVADDGAHLFCWTTQRHLPATLEIIEAWGFTYCLTMVWHKSGGPQPWGLPQYNCEFAVYARRGTPQFVDTKQFFACFEAPRREHSRKPDQFYELLRRVAPGPRVDIFSREPREGFEQFGNEAGKFGEAA